MSPSRTAFACVGLAVLGLHSCQSVAQEVDAGADAPLYLSGEFDSTIGYLLARYDRNADAAITRDEYGRDDQTWERLDRNRDGAIDQADFEPGEDERDGLDLFATQFMISKYFQTDDEVARVDLGELRTGFAAYDTDRDGTIADAEFRCAFEQNAKTVPGDQVFSAMFREDDPWETILAGADADGDGALAMTELETFFHALVEGDEEVWISEVPMAVQVNEGAGARTARVEPEDGALEGELAPDFTLSTPDGRATVQLSSFAGRQPVALIFGSYT